MASKIGFVIILANETVDDDAFTLQGNIVHYSSAKCKWVTRHGERRDVRGTYKGRVRGVRGSRPAGWTAALHRGQEEPFHGLGFDTLTDGSLSRWTPITLLP